MAYRTIRGKILYTSKKPERLDQERGREYFSITRQPDGTDVMHAHCEIDDEPMVVRDVVAAMDRRTAAPRDCHVRLTVGGRSKLSCTQRRGAGRCRAPADGRAGG